MTCESPTFWGYKTHAGNACFAQLGHESAYLDRAPQYVVNVAFDQREGLRIVCPIVRDNAEPSKIDASVTPGVCESPGGSTGTETSRGRKHFGLAEVLHSDSLLDV
jgi:hypothetical protein